MEIPLTVTGQRNGRGAAAARPVRAEGMRREVRRRDHPLAPGRLMSNVGDGLVHLQRQLTQRFKAYDGLECEIHRLGDIREWPPRGPSIHLGPSPSLRLDAAAPRWRNSRRGAGPCTFIFYSYDVVLLSRCVSQRTRRGQTERETEREQVNSSTRDGACASDAVRYVLFAPTVAHLCRYVHSSRALRCFTAGRAGI